MGTRKYNYKVPNIKSHIYKITNLILIVFLVSCTQVQKEEELIPHLPKPLRSPMQSNLTPTLPSAQERTTARRATEPKTHFYPVPQIPKLKSTAESADNEFVPRFTVTAPIQINIEGLPLPAFINEVFGNLLGLSFDIDAELQQKKELVTLRVTKPQKPPQLFQLARQVLTNYGVAIQNQGKLLRFVPTAYGEDAPPLLIQGTMPEVPPSHRPIIQFIPLKVVNNTKVKNWIKQVFKGHKLEVLEDGNRNAIVLIGNPQLIKQATEAVRVLDQPLMRGRHSLRIEPAFLPVKTLTDKLIKVLQTQGYDAGTNPRHANGIILLPIVESNSILVFAVDAKVLAYVQQWAIELDRIQIQPSAEKQQLFFFPVQNSNASDIVQVLNPLLAEISNDPPKSEPRGAPPRPKRKPKLMVDTPHNSIIFVGDAAEWARLLPLLHKMDKPPKQVLIEATLAEITLSDKDERGIEWVMNNANLGGLGGKLSTIGLGTGSNGLTYTLSNASEVRAVLNLFTSKNRATILSNPRLLVRSGSQASIEIGTEIPTLTSTTSGLQRDTNVIQQIQYRSTGTSLKIKPIVYAGRRVELDISQQVSESQPNETSNIDSPVIFNRQIQTQLSLSDGQSVLLGGLIADSRSSGQTGVPILKDIPLIGQFFRSDKSSGTRTELVIMIIPYVIDNADEAKAITEAVKSQLEWLPNK